MKTRMMVVNIEKAETLTGKERIRVTLKHYLTNSDDDVLRLTLTPAQAKPFRLGRYFYINITSGPADAKENDNV